MLKYYIYFLKNFKVYNIYTHTHIHTYIHHTPSTSQKISIYIYSYPTQKISKVYTPLFYPKNFKVYIYIHTKKYTCSTQKISKRIYIYKRKNIPIPPKKFQSIYIYSCTTHPST